MREYGSNAQLTKATIRSDLYGNPGAAVPEMIGLLKHSDGKRRELAALVLGAIGEDAVGAIPDLERLQHDADENVRTAAARTLGTLRSLAASR